MTVVVFLSGRADLHPLRPVITRLATDASWPTVVVASRRVADQGEDLTEFRALGVAVRWVGAQESDSSTLHQLGCSIASAVGEVIRSVDARALVVLGDRWELLFAVPPATVAAVPVVHLHGGEVTEGAIDDRVRHAISKLADLHCVSTPMAARRLRQLGESSDRISVTGAPSLDCLTATAPLDGREIAAIVGDAWRRPLALVTYHPETTAPENSGDAARLVFDACAEASGTVVVTEPGLDIGRELVLHEINRAVAHHANLVYLPTLGHSYIPLLASADFVAGNSSSGIIEAATFGVPVVDVGDRQKGRERGPNVVHSPAQAERLREAIATVQDLSFRATARQAPNLYGDGGASNRIVELVHRACTTDLRRKPFVDCFPENTP